MAHVCNIKKPEKLKKRKTSKKDYTIFTDFYNQNVRNSRKR